MELWKDIRDYNGFYQVSSEGRVKALAREIINKNGDTQKYPEKVLRPALTNAAHTTYYRVTLSKAHISNRISVHRLVAQAFLPAVLGKNLINHIDNDGTNNSYTNL